MTDDGAALLRAILANPGEDSVRLGFADWCDDNGQPERAAFVRWQIATGFVASRAAREGAQVYSLQNRQDAPRGFIRSIRALVDALPERCGFEISRGFISHIELPCAAFMEHAEAIFQSHPVTSVDLTDREPENMEAGFTWFQNPFATLGMASNIPWQLFDCLTGGKSAISQNYDMRSYAMHAIAITALSHACVRYGRKLVNLPPLPVTALPASS